MARAVPVETSRDTIVSRATAAGDGAIAIVRLSGNQSAPIAARLFRPRANISFTQLQPGQLVLGKLSSHEQDNDLIDECLAVLWRAPHSYTGEDMVEFHVHGSHVIVARLIEASLAAGARIALPGEFTRRAYMNGKLDLAQAEAVCDLIASQTDAAGRAALAQLGGGLSRRIEALRARLVPVLAELEAHVDFPEEGLEFATRERLGKSVDGCIGELHELLESSRRGMYLREGARVVLAGPPNAGKSSLFNLLLRRERALVTPHAGTTRDTIEAQVELAGVPLTLVDTAGLRETPEEIEALGIEKTHEEIGGADLVLFLVDHQNPAEAFPEYERLRQLNHIVVINKSDLPGAASAEQFFGHGRKQLLRISIRHREGIDELERALVEHFDAPGSTEVSGLVTNRRHADALRKAARALETAAEGIASELSPEFIVVDLTEAADSLDRITGRQTLDEDVLDAVFATFCLGK